MREKEKSGYLLSLNTTDQLKHITGIIGWSVHSFFLWVLLCLLCVASSIGRGLLFAVSIRHDTTKAEERKREDDLSSVPGQYSRRIEENASSPGHLRWMEVVVP